MKKTNIKNGRQNSKSIMFLAFCLVFISIFTTTALSQSFLSASGTKIVNTLGNEVQLKGVNLGNWVLQEGWMISNDGNNPGTQVEMKKLLYDRGFSDAQVEAFYQGWRDNFVTKADIDYLASKGFNHVRLPMHYDLFLTPAQRAVRHTVIRDKSKYANYKTQLASWVASNTIATDYTVEGYKIIDNLINWCAANNMYVILDMHAVPGSQGTDEHIADCIHTPNDLWYSVVNQDVLNAMWKNISLRYKNNATIAMYDLINEPNNAPSTTMRTVFQRLITTIRNNGDNHLILLEGNGWGNNYTNNLPTDFSPRTNLVYNIHRYDFDAWPCSNDLNFKYSDPNQIQVFGAAQEFRTKYNVPIYCGETGLRNYAWMKDNTMALDLLGMGWAIWSYKWHTGMAYDYGVGGIVGLQPAQIFTSADMNTVLENIKFSNMYKNTNPGFWDALFPVPPTPVPVTGVALTPATATINTNATLQLVATISPSNATNKNITWASSNTAIATVSSTGLVTAKAAGTATITVTTQDGPKTATSAITVVVPVQEPFTGTPIAIPGTVEAENFDKGGQGLAYNDTDAANQGNQYGNQYRTTEGVDIEVCTEGGYNVGWTAAGEWIEYTVNVASAGNYDITARVASEIGGTFRIEFNNVDKTGTLTVGNTGGWQAWQNVSKTGVALSAGTQIMKVHIISGSFNLNKITFTGGQSNVAVTGVTMSPTSVSIANGSTSQLTATVAPSNATNKNVSWASSNTAIATVSSTGLVTAKAAGSATITVTTQDGAKKATCAVTVTNPNIAVTGVAMSPTSVSIANGSSSQLTATVAPSNATNKNVSWASSNTAIATVSSTGLVTAKAAGSATITVTTQDGAKKATCAVTVTPNTTLAIPGKIEAESFSVQSGIQTETTSDVGGGLNVGWIDANDYMDYNVNVATTGTYIVEFRIASTIANAKLQLLKGTTVLGTLTVATATGGWQNWTSQSISVSLTAGVQTLRVKAVTNGFNLNYMNFSIPDNNLAGYFNIISLHSNKALDVKDLSTVSGANIQQWELSTAGGGANQRWSFSDAGNGNYYIKVKSTLMCLDLETANLNNGTKVVQKTCNNANSQKWSVTSIENGLYRIMNAYSQKSLDVSDLSTSNGALIQVWDLGNNQANQKWSFIKVETTTSNSLIETDIAKMNSKPDVSVYPNPASNFVTIGYLPDSQIKHIEIYNLEGKVIFNQIAVPDSETTINISHLNAGIYLIKTIGENKTEVFKLIKK